MLSPAWQMFCTASAVAAWPELTRHGRHAAFEGGHFLFQRIAGRVGDAAVDVADFLQREKAGRMFGVAELEGGCLVNRHRNGAGRRVHAGAGVKGKGFGVGKRGHSEFPFKKQAWSSKFTRVSRGSGPCGWRSRCCRG